MKKILVTGANGQLGKCIKEAAFPYPNFEIIYASKKMLDIEDQNSILNIFKKHTFDYCINNAAYTNVEKAESEPEKAFAINAEAAKYLAILCKENNVVLIHISTDYVFDGKKESPYLETDSTNPINVYGASKLKGEQYIQSICEKYFIFRTSWLYSQYGNNFLNTILKYSSEKKPLTITTEQTGTPTNANDLAKMLLDIINTNSNEYGLYNYSNDGKATWYDFAKAILKYSPEFEATNLAQTDYYRTFASRPKYSVLDKKKFFNTFNLETKEWKESLKSVLIAK